MLAGQLEQFCGTFHGSLPRQCCVTPKLLFPYTCPTGPANGKLAKSGKRVVVHYTGRLKNSGKVFDKSGNKPFSFRLGEFRCMGCQRVSVGCPIQLCWVFKPQNKCRSLVLKQHAGCATQPMSLGLNIQAQHVHISAVGEAREGDSVLGERSWLHTQGRALRACN